VEVVSTPQVPVCDFVTLACDRRVRNVLRGVLRACREFNHVTQALADTCGVVLIPSANHPVTMAVLPRKVNTAVSTLITEIGVRCILVCRTVSLFYAGSFLRPRKDSGIRGNHWLFDTSAIHYAKTLTRALVKVRLALPLTGDQMTTSLRGWFRNAESRTYEGVFRVAAIRTFISVRLRPFSLNTALWWSECLAVAGLDERIEHG
jgi:hypothetical protein